MENIIQEPECDEIKLDDETIQQNRDNFKPKGKSKKKNKKVLTTSENELKNKLRNKINDKKNNRNNTGNGTNSSNGTNGSNGTNDNSNIINNINSADISKLMANINPNEIMSMFNKFKDEPEFTELLNKMNK